MKNYRIISASAKSLQSCPTLCDPIDGNPPGSPVPGILQARTLEWVAISFSNAWKWSRLAMSDSSRPHGLQPTRLLHPWDFPGKSTGVGCHRLLRLHLQGSWKARSFEMVQFYVGKNKQLTYVYMYGEWGRMKKSLLLLFTSTGKMTDFIHFCTLFRVTSISYESRIGIITTCKSVRNASSQASAQNYRIRMCTVIILHGFMCIFKFEKYFSIHHAVRNATTQLCSLLTYFFTCNPQHNHFNASHCFSVVIP